MKITILYVFPVLPQYFDYAARFVTTVLEHPAGVDFDILVVSNGGPPRGDMKALFSPFKTKWIEHDNSGLDIGAMKAAVNHLDCDMVFVCGANCYVRREGWLARIASVWNRKGPGMYGTLASFEIRPHINTTGFACPPSLLKEYFEKFPTIQTRADRYHFEHGHSAMHIMAARKGLPVRLVTWDGTWEKPHWRTPENIYRRGDQSNCLTYFSHTDEYDLADPELRNRMTLHSDGIGTTNFLVATAAEM